jgi:acyl transferase domain-containing protein
LASKTNMLSFDGKCKTFDDAANGIVPGEGVGAMVLKPLTKAIADGDHIYGVIKGSGINQDGKTKGITAPSMLSQKELIWSAYQNASINPETVSFIEAHGTGTKLGDPIEIKALIEAFRMFTDKTHFCAVNSHKPNFGHTITAAGIAGVFSILMALKHKKLYPLISFNEINKYIDLHESPFFFNTKLGEWKSNDESPLRAGISSFGFSGTNCHVIIEEPPFLENVPENDQIRYYPFFFSAKTKMSLKRKIQDLHKWLVKEADNYPILNISYTLLTGRDHYSVRSGFIASSIEELKSKISEINSNGTADGYFTNNPHASRGTTKHETHRGKGHKKKP